MLAKVASSADTDLGGRSDLLISWGAAGPGTPTPVRSAPSVV